MTDAADERPAGGVRWFGMPARRVIIAFMALFAVGTLTYRGVYPPDERQSLRLVIGRPYSDFAFYFGAPAKEEPDGQDGSILSYNDVAVSGDRFVEAPFRIFVDRHGRIYRIEFD